MINVRELRRLSSQGLPDGGGLRSTVWKVCVFCLFDIGEMFLVFVFV